jgi:predicted acetyltransferase
MTVSLVPIERAQHETLRNLLQLYSYDFSELLGLEVRADGRFAEVPLEPWWADPLRFPFFVRAGEALAGFALVHHQSRLTDSPEVWDVSEFFVLRKHRRTGVGTLAAALLFAKFRGPWEVRQRPENVAATAFWRKAIAAFTGGPFSEQLDHPRWKGPVQSFTSRSPS